MCPQASEMHACVASLCEALSARVSVCMCVESVSMAVSVAAHVPYCVELRICGQKKQPFVYLYSLAIIKKLLLCLVSCFVPFLKILRC